MAIIEDPVEDPTGLMPSASIDAQIKVSDEHDTLGREPTSKTVRLENEANVVSLDGRETSDPLAVFNDSVAKSFTSGGNWAYELYKRGEREMLSPAPDPSFNSADFVRRNRNLIPQNLEKQFHLATSETEANLILSDMNDELRKQEVLARRGGFSTFVAAGLAGIVDIDTPLAVLSGGASAGFKGGILATKWGRMMGSAAAGGLTQAAAQTAAFEAGTTGDWTSIPAAGLGGMAFGLAGGAMRKEHVETRANASIEKAAKEFDETVTEGTPLANRDPRTDAHIHDDPYGSIAASKAEQAAEAEAEKELVLVAPEGATGSTFKLSELDVAPDSIGESGAPAGATMRDIQGEEGGSIGARQLATQGSVATIESPRIKQMISDAKKFLQKSGVLDDYNEKYSALSQRGQAGDTIAKGAARFHDALASSPFATDFDRMWRSGSAVAQRLAYDLFENAGGIVRNNRSAAMVKDLYEKQLLGSFLPHYETGIQLWAKDNGISWYDRMTKSSVREKFNREVITELNGRAFDAPGTQRQISDGVKLAADAHDAWSKLDIEIGKGRPGEGSIKGYENLTPYSGYYSQKWSGSNIERMIRTGGKTAAQIEQAVSEAYVAKHGMAKADADKYAAAMVRRARASERGTDMNLIGILQQDGRGYLTEILRDNGISQHDADKLIDKLTGAAAERGQAGHTKGRIDVDLRFTASNGINLMDLVDTDMARLVARRARGTSGAAALARKGITSRMDRAEIKEAILQEQYAKGRNVPTGTGMRDKFGDLIDKDRHLTPEHIDDMFSYFDAGPISGGISPFWSNAKKLTNLALLNQLGLTQAAETGAQIASVGLKRWFEHAGGAIRGNAANPQSHLAQELRHMGVLVPEEKLFRDDFNLEMDRAGPAQSELMQKFSHMLNQGQRVQGYASGFYAVRNFQQRVAVTSAADKIMQNMAGLAKDLSADRAADIGLDPKLYARIAKKYANPPVGAKKRKTAIVEFKDGSLHKLNMDKWEPQDAEDFALALNRHVNQVVQRAMAGESSILFHKDGIASIFFHLKSFSLLAIEKQAGRNFKMADAEAASTFIAGLVTAAAAYTVKQGINGNTQNLSVGKIANGAFGLSNMTGWLPMWTDPVASMLGMDALKFNAYSRGVDGNILSTPAALTTINRMANIPAIPMHALAGNLSNNDIRALQTTPIIGNAYGFTAMFNALKK
jgi:hypothetical protein